MESAGSPRPARTSDYSSVVSEAGPALRGSTQGEVWEGPNGELAVLLGGIGSVSCLACGRVTVRGIGTESTRESSSASSFIGVPLCTHG